LRFSEDAEWLRTFTIITGEPGRVSSNIHDRQPVILRPDLLDVWLESTPDDALATLQSMPEAELSCYPVSKAVGSPRNNGAKLVERIALEQT
jgi:putative SOS response-associated peptidase YedK